MFKSYDVVDAASLIAMTPPTTTDAELKVILIAATDIPEDRIDACLAELKGSGMINNLRGLAMVYKMATGDEPTPASLKTTFQGAAWNDDGESHTTYKLTVADEDGTTNEVTVKTTY